MAVLGATPATAQQRCTNFVQRGKDFIYATEHTSIHGHGYCVCLNTYIIYTRLLHCFPKQPKSLHAESYNYVADGTQIKHTLNFTYCQTKQFLFSDPRLPLNIDRVHKAGLLCDIY